MATPEQEAILHNIIEGYKATQFVTYLGVGGHALVLADFLHTFPTEVRLMWPTPLSTVKVLFFVLRYYIIIHHSVFATMYGLPKGLSPESCSAAFSRLGHSSVLVITAAEGILFLRVYAFSGKNKKIMFYLLLQFAAIHATAFVLLTRFLQSVKFTQMPFSNVACMPAEAKSTLLGGVFALFLGSVLIVMLIMMLIAFRKHRNFNSTLLTVFYRDGIFYFVCLSALASANIVVNLAAPEGFKFLFIQTEIDVHVILSTRMLMHLREWAERDRREGDTTRLDMGGTMADAMGYSTDYGHWGHGGDGAAAPVRCAAADRRKMLQRDGIRFADVSEMNYLGEVVEESSSGTATTEGRGGVQV